MGLGTIDIVSNAVITFLRSPRSSYAVTSSDTVAQTATKGLYVGVTGDIVGRLADDVADRTWKAVPVGYLPGNFVLIKLTGTTATNIIGYQD